MQQQRWSWLDVQLGSYLLYQPTHLPRYRGAIRKEESEKRTFPASDGDGS